MPNQELLRTIEHGQTRSSRLTGPEHIITPIHVQEVVARRKLLFGTVERYISTRLQQMLREKIASEEKALLAIVAAQQQALVAAKKTAQILNRAFFELRPLDVSLFE